MEFADVSVVMPFGDHEHLVGKAARSIHEFFRAASLSVEIIAVDQGSSDNSQPVLHLLRSEIPELRVIVGRNYGAGAREADSPVLVLLTPEQAATPLPSSMLSAIAEVASRQLDMKLLDERLLVCSTASCSSLIGNTSSRLPIQRKLLQRGRSLGLMVRSYGPEEPVGRSRRISKVLAAVVPGASSLLGAW